MLFQITDISFDLEESCPYCGGDCIEFPITSCDDFAANATEVISEKRDIAIKIMEVIWEAKNENDLKQEILEETGEVVDYIDWESVDESEVEELEEIDDLDDLDDDLDDEEDEEDEDEEDED